MRLLLLCRVQGGNYCLALAGSHEELHGLRSVVQKPPDTPRERHAAAGSASKSSSATNKASLSAREVWAVILANKSI